MKDKVLYILVCLFMLFGGIGGIYYGVHRFVAAPDQVVYCGGQVMNPGETCRETRKGSATGAKSYSEQKDAQNSLGGPITGLVVGSLLAIVGGGGLWLQVSSRSKAAAKHPSSTPMAAAAPPVLAATPPAPAATPSVPAAKFRPTVLPFTGLVRPSGVAVDAAGNVYITDNGTDRVVMLAAGSNSATVLPFTGLVRPSGVAVDAAGNVYITDNGTDRVVMLAAGSNSATVLPFTGLVRPSGVAVDAAGNVYVSAERVVMLAAGSNSATVLPFTGLVRPSGVAVDAAGNVYVSEFGAERVMVLVAETSTPKVLGPFTGLCGPTGVAVDGAGSVYVGDLGSGFGKGRVLMLAAGSSRANGLPFGRLEYPGGVAVDSGGSVYVVDGAIAGDPRVVKLAAA